MEYFSCWPVLRKIGWIYFLKVLALIDLVSCQLIGIHSNKNGYEYGSKQIWLYGLECIVHCGVNWIHFLIFIKVSNFFQRPNSPLPPWRIFTTAICPGFRNPLNANILLRTFDPPDCWLIINWCPSWTMRPCTRIT